MPNMSTIPNLALRFLQFVFAIAVIGLYATDINDTRKAGHGSDSRWVYAVVVGTLSAVTSLVCGLPMLETWYAFGWDIVLFILWVAVFGLFGKLYIHQKANGNSDVSRMKNAVWVDLVNMLLWLVTAVMASMLFFMSRRRRSLHTGRATV